MAHRTKKAELSARLADGVIIRQEYDACDCQTYAEYIENHGEDLTMACLSYGMDLEIRSKLRAKMVAGYAISTPVSHSMRGKHSKR
jgi:hypothetical protein